MREEFILRLRAYWYISGLRGFRRACDASLRASHSWSLLVSSKSVNLFFSVCVPVVRRFIALWGSSSKWSMLIGSISGRVLLTRSTVWIDSVPDGTVLLGMSLRDSSKGMLGSKESQPESESMDISGGVSDSEGIDLLLPVGHVQYIYDKLSYEVI